MIVILASRYDETAGRLAARWSAVDGCVLTCEDLSVGGWRYDPGRPLAGTAVVNGREVAPESIRGMLTRLPSISDVELTQIAPADRYYVAAEMTAFLACWLTTLPCPVLNRPAPGCLTGPILHAEQWAAAAAKLGMRVRPPLARLGLSPCDDSQSVMVTIVGDRCFGEVDAALLLRASQLARTTGVDLLGVQFSSPEPDGVFVGVSTIPSAESPEVADAILDYFTDKREGRNRPLGSEDRRSLRRSARLSMPDNR
jgi:hypothetical protein